MAVTRIFGPVVFHPSDTEGFEARCFAAGYDCMFRIGDTCTHVQPPRWLEGLPFTPDWCEMKAAALADAAAAG